MYVKLSKLKKSVTQKIYFQNLKSHEAPLERQNRCPPEELPPPEEGCPPKVLFLTLVWAKLLRNIASSPSVDS